MANVLHIQASENAQRSFSIRVADAFLSAYRAAHPGDEIRTLDLAAKTVPQFDGLAINGKYRILHGQKHTPEEAAAWRAVEAVIADFKKLDKLVISSPMWNFGIPYRLKQYFDVLAQPGYTFSYTPQEGYKGLVTGKPAMLILARGGEYPSGTPGAAYDHQRPYLELILGFIGFQKIDAVVVEPTLMAGPDVAAKKLEEAIKAAKEKARMF